MSYSLLIADNDSHYRKMIFNYFEEIDFEISTISNGEKALNAILNYNLDFAILDYHLPGLSGHEILKSISNYDIETSIIVTTQDPSSETEQEIRKFSPDFLFVKPFDIENLGLVVENIIRTEKVNRAFTV